MNEPGRPDALPPVPTTPPKRSSNEWRMPRWAVVVGGIALVAVGWGAGTNETSGEGSPRPTRTVTDTEFITNETEVTPSACIQALNFADRGFGLAGKSLGAAGKGFGAASRFDIAGIVRAGEQIDDLHRDIVRVGRSYRRAKSACHATA
ncbi:MAG: hypothetical protein WD556_11280 [Actinomycetota bacterium]